LRCGLLVFFDAVAPHGTARITKPRSLDGPVKYQNPGTFGALFYSNRDSTCRDDHYCAGFAVPGCLFHGGTIRLRMNNIDEY
jgi:hypothetical protein